LKLNEVISSRVPPDSKIPSTKKTQLIRKYVRNKFALRRKLRDVALGKNVEYVPDPDPMDYLNGHEDNAATFS